MGSYCPTSWSFFCSLLTPEVDAFGALDFLALVFEFGSLPFLDIGYVAVYSQGAPCRGFL